MVSAMLTVAVAVQICFEAVEDFPARYNHSPLKISYSIDLFCYSFLQLFQLFSRLKQVVLLQPPSINVVQSKRGFKAEIVARRNHDIDEG